jgi:hypothetical protein
VDGIYAVPTEWVNTDYFAINLTPKSHLHNREGTSKPPVNMIFSPSPIWRRGWGMRLKQKVYLYYKIYHGYDVELWL